MAGISVSGNKKIATLQKDFNEQFPYLHICIAYSYARDDVKKGGSIRNIPGDKTIASVRRGEGKGTISIAGNKRVSSLETEFDKVFGLYCQVCYTKKDGHAYYTSGSSDSMTLCALNEWAKKNGCKKGVWH